MRVIIQYIEKWEKLKTRKMSKMKLKVESEYDFVCVW